MKLKDVLAKFQAGEISLKELIDAHNAELDEMKAIKELVGDDGEWMKAGDQLEGETVGEKQAAYIARDATVQQAKKAIEDTHAANDALRNAGSPVPANHMDDKTPKLFPQVKGSLNDPIEVRKDFEAQIAGSPGFEAIGKQDQRGWAINIDMGTTPGKYFKALIYSGEISTQPVGFSPSIGLTPVPINALYATEFFNFVPGADVLRSFGVPLVAAGTRSINEAMVHANAMERPTAEIMKDLYGYVEIPNESIQDVPGIVDALISQMMKQVLLLLQTQVITGDAQDENINGILTQLTVDNVAASTTRSIYDELDLRVRTMMEAGKNPNGIIVPVAINANIVANLRRLGFSIADLDRNGPFGAIVSVPMALASTMPANTALIGDFMMGHAVGIRRDLTIEDDVSFAFNRNAVAIRGILRAANIVRDSSYFEYVGALNGLTGS